jgi:protein-disulfide isomerase
VDQMKKGLLFFIGGLALGAILTSGVFLSKSKNQAVDVSSAIGVPLLKVDGDVISTASLPKEVRMEYYMLENSIYSAKENFANQVALRMLLAKDSHKDSKELPPLKDLIPLQPVSDLEAKQYYDQITARMGKAVFGGQSFDQIKTQLENRINQERGAQLMNQKIDEFQKGGRFEFLLKHPESPAVDLDLTGYAVRGNPKAKVTLVEVADYLCPHCREAQPAIEKVYQEFKDKIKFVQVTYPLNPNMLSGALAKGAFCALKQGNDLFWKYHAAAFQVPWDKNNAPAGQNPDSYFSSVAVDVAKSVGLNDTAFAACLSSKEANDSLSAMQSQFNESKGFQGTPTFYLNNKMVQIEPDQLAATLKAALSK